MCVCVCVCAWLHRQLLEGLANAVLAIFDLQKRIGTLAGTVHAQTMTLMCISQPISPPLCMPLTPNLHRPHWSR